MQVRIDTSEDPRLAKILDTVSSIQTRALGRLGRGIERASLEIVGAAVKGSAFTLPTLIYNF